MMAIVGIIIVTLSSNSTSGTINPKALSITSPSITSKTYDGSTTAGTVNIGTLSGFVGARLLQPQLWLQTIQV